MNEKISAFLSERIAAHDFPSAVYLVAEKGEIVYHDALGNAVVTPEVIPANLDTIYDLASLTKVLVTALLVAQRIDERDLTVDAKISHFLSEFKAADKAEITILQLANHTSAFRDWIPLYLKSDNLLHVTETVAAEPAATPRGESVIYSDLNFIALANVIETLSRFRVDISFSDVTDELQLSRTDFTPLSNAPRPWTRDKIAASEFGNEYERQTCIEKFPELRIPQSAFRTRQIWGEVHDGNAYFMGGAAGHAGLFSTAEEVFKIALQFLPQYTTLLKPETCELFRTNFTKGLNEDRSFAFQLASTEGSTAGTSMSPESFGHNGFTGTSLWIDPVKDRIFILLTNRTHNHPLPFTNINSVRRRFHDLAIEELEKR